MVSSKEIFGKTVDEAKATAADAKEEESRFILVSWEPNSGSHRGGTSRTRGPLH